MAIISIGALFNCGLHWYRYSSRLNVFFVKHIHNRHNEKQVRLEFLKISNKGATTGY